MTSVKDCLARLEAESRCEHLEPLMRELVRAMESPESKTLACQEAQSANGVQVLARSVKSMCQNLTEHSGMCAGLAVRALYVVVANGEQDAGHHVEPGVAGSLRSSLLAYMHWAQAHSLEYRSVQCAVCLLLAIIDDDLAHAREIAAGGGASLCLDLMSGVGGKRDALCRLLCLVFEEGAYANLSKKKAFVNAELRRGTPQRIVALVLEMQRESHAAKNKARNEKNLANLYAALNVVADSERGMDALLATEVWASIAENACQPRSCTLLGVAVTMLTAKMLMRDEALASGLFHCLDAYSDRVVALCQEHPEDKRLQVASVSIFKILAQTRVKIMHALVPAPAAPESWVTKGSVVAFVRSTMQRQDLGEGSSSVMLALLRQLYHLHGRKWAVGADGGIAELLALLQKQNPAHDLLSAMCALFALTRNTYQNKLRFIALGGVRTVLDLCEQNKVHNDTVKVVCEILQVVITDNGVRRKFFEEGGLRFVDEAFRQVGATWGPVTLVLKLLCMSTFPCVPQMLECGLLSTIVDVCERRDLAPENAFGLLVSLQWVCAHPASVKHAEGLRVRQTALGLLRRFSDDKNVVETTILLLCSMYAMQPWAITAQEFREMVLRQNEGPCDCRAMFRGLRLARLVAEHEAPSRARDNLWLEVAAKLAKLASSGTCLHDMWYPVLVLAAELVGKHVDERALKHVRVVVDAFSKQSDDEPLVSNRLRLFNQLQAWVLECEERESARERLAEEMFATLMLDQGKLGQSAQTAGKAKRRGKRRPQAAASATSTSAETPALASPRQGTDAPVPSVRLREKVQPGEPEAPGPNMECVVCMERVKTHALVPCYHMCVCSGCAEKVVKALGTCPMCNASTTQAQRVWV